MEPGVNNMNNIGPEESVVLNALLPEVFALVSLLKVELNDVLVVALQENGF